MVIRALLRVLAVLSGVCALIALAWHMWQPGANLQKIAGTEQMRQLFANKQHGIWMQHAWLADDAWLARNGKRADDFRDPTHLRATADLLRQHGVRYLYPHLCPAQPDGKLPASNAGQVERFLSVFDDFDVLPWIGGANGASAQPESPAWRRGFANSIHDLMAQHPRLAGVHVNIEPLKSGDVNFVTLLHEVRQALPEKKILSVAAYPPDTFLQPSPEVHWRETFFRLIAGRCDQMVVMMYDTGLPSQKIYQWLMADWTAQVLEWSAGTGPTRRIGQMDGPGMMPVLLGVPAYEDAGVAWHDPAVENLSNALSGITAGLTRSPASNRKHFGGVAIYNEWEMDATEWTLLANVLGKTKPATAAKPGAAMENMRQK
jgi:hypothetical protein